MKVIILVYIQFIGFKIIFLKDAWDKPLPKVSRSKPEEKNVASKPKYKKKS